MTPLTSEQVEQLVIDNVAIPTNGSLPIEQLDNASNAKLLKCLERMEEAITDADDARNMRGTHLCAGWDCSNCARITNPLYAALDDVRAILEEGK